MTYDVENPRLGLEEIHIICLLFRFVVFQELYRGGQIWWWRKLEEPEKTTDLSQVIDQLYHILLYTSSWLTFELTTSVVIGTDCIYSCKSNYHTITGTTVPRHNYVTGLNRCFCNDKEYLDPITFLSILLIFPLR